MMRFVCAVSLALMLTGVAGAASAGHGTLALAGMLESHGAPALGSAPVNGEELRFLSRAPFQIGVVLENETGGRIIVTGARVLEPTRTLIHQIGTRFHAWKPPRCTGLCGAYGFELKGGVGRPRPTAIARGKGLGVELDFRLGSCGHILGANPAPVSRLRISYRNPGGQLRHRIVPLNGAELHLRMPRPADCVGPHSSLGVDGPNPYPSSDDWTIPGSTGDVCAIHDGTLSFVSREYQTDIPGPFKPGDYERITLRMPFHGTGAYGSHAVLTLVADRITVFRADARVRVTKATGTEVIANIGAGHLPAGGARRMPFRIEGTMRCRVRG